MAKLAKSKTARSAKTKLSESSSLRTESQPGGKKAEKISAAASQSTEGNSQKKVSQKLLETIEKRKNRAKSGGMFGKPPGRRGRRPKNAAEYTPVNTEEDGYVLESDYEGIEYDTGIRLKEGGEDGAFSMDRFEDFDEELNFDR